MLLTFPSALRWSNRYSINPIKCIQILKTTPTLSASPIKSRAPFRIVSVSETQRLIFYYRRILINSPQDEPRTVSAAPVRSSGGHVCVSATVARSKKRRRVLPDMVRGAESTRGSEVVMEQTEGLHCEGQKRSSWEQSNTGIKPHIFRVM